MVCTVSIWCQYLQKYLLWRHSLCLFYVRALWNKSVKKKVMQNRARGRCQSLFTVKNSPDAGTRSEVSGRIKSLSFSCVCFDIFLVKTEHEARARSVLITLVPLLGYHIFWADKITQEEASDSCSRFSIYSFILLSLRLFLLRFSNCLSS